MAIDGLVCKYCKLMFCFAHALPEVHGCGGAAKDAGRISLRGPARPKDLVSKDARRAQLSNRLQKAIGEKAEPRMRDDKDKAANGQLAGGNGKGGQKKKKKKKK